MSLPPFASLADLEARLGRTLTGAEATRAEALLGDASAAVRRFTGQEITFRSSTDRVLVRDGCAVLSQWPVIAVSGATDINGVALSPTWDGGQVVELGAVWVINATPSTLAATPYADVTYAHGFAEVPDDIAAIVCQMAARAFGRSADLAGVTSETIGSYSVTVGAAAAAGAVGMLEDEKRILRAFKPPRQPISTLAR